MKEFDPHQYTLAAGWDFGCVLDTAEQGLSEADEAAIDQWAGVRPADYDPVDDQDARQEADAVEAAKAARFALVNWCLDRADERNRVRN